MSLFSDGLNFLSQELFKNAETTVSITRNGVGLGTFKTIPTTSNYENLGEKGEKIFASVPEFLFKKTSEYVPQIGDLFVFSDGRKFEVRSSVFKQKAQLKGEDVWHLDDEQGAIVVTRAQRIV